MPPQPPVAPSLAPCNYVGFFLVFFRFFVTLLTFFFIFIAPTPGNFNNEGSYTTAPTSGVVSVPMQTCGFFFLFSFVFFVTLLTFISFS